MDDLHANHYSERDVAQLYPQQVAGVVLLDSMHPEQYTKIAS